MGRHGARRGRSRRVVRPPCRRLHRPRGRRHLRRTIEVDGRAKWRRDARRDPDRADRYLRRRSRPARRGPTGRHGAHHRPRRHEARRQDREGRGPRGVAGNPRDRLPAQDPRRCAPIPPRRQAGRGPRGIPGTTGRPRARRPLAQGLPRRRRASSRWQLPRLETVRERLVQPAPRGGRRTDRLRGGEGDRPGSDPATSTGLVAARPQASRRRSAGRRRRPGRHEAGTRGDRTRPPRDPPPHRGHGQWDRDEDRRGRRLDQRLVDRHPRAAREDQGRGARPRGAPDRRPESVQV